MRPVAAASDPELCSVTRRDPLLTNVADAALFKTRSAQPADAGHASSSVPEHRSRGVRRDSLRSTG